MLTVNEAREIGIKACIDKLGYEFCKKHADNATSAYGEEDEFVYCYVGVDDQPLKKCEDSEIKELRLSSRKEDRFPYCASCNVYKKDGSIEFIECILPTEL